MKKTIPASLLLIALLLSVCGCQHPNTEIPRGTETEVVPTESNSDSKTTAIETNTDDILHTGTESYFYDPEKNITHRRDAQGTNYICLKDWDKTYVMPDNFISYSDAVILENVAWLISHRNAQISVWRFSRDCSAVELYTHIYHAEHSAPIFTFANFWSECEGCVFFWDDRDEKNCWPVQFLKTNDGGETWYTVECQTPIRAQEWREYPHIAKFISADTGIISYRDYQRDLDERTYITLDGGRTWKNITLPTCQTLVCSSNIEISDFRHTEFGYELIITAQEKGTGASLQIRFVSSDARIWVFSE